MNGCLDTVLISVGVAAFLLIPLAYNRYFYFEDDFQSQYMPIVIEIAHQLKAGTFPLIAHDSWHGGALLAQYQYAIFNPICLLLDICADWFSDIALAAAFYVIVHYVIFVAGAHVLCLMLGYSRRGAAIGAVSACSSTWLLYWAAHSWTIVLMSISWMPWCFAALLLVYQNPRWLSLGAIATALPIVTGWPFTTISIGFVIVVALTFAVAAKKPLSRVLHVALAAALGLALSLPAILPTAIYLHYLGHATDLVDRFKWRASFEGLMTGGMPTYFGPWISWAADVRVYPVSFYYFGWFVPIVLVNARKTSFEAPFAKVLLALTGIFGVLSVFPTFGIVRWSFRFLPYFDFCAALLVASVITTEMSQTLALWRWRLNRTAAVIGVQFFIAFWSLPEAFFIHLLFLAVVSILAVGAAWALSKNGAFVAWLLAGHALILFTVIATVPTNPAIPDWYPPTARVPVDENANAVREISLFEPLGGREITEDAWRHLSIGNHGLLYGRNSINGYNPFAAPSLGKILCFNWISASCSDVASKLFESDPQTGLPMIDLLGLSVVTVEKGPLLDSFKRLSGPDWVESVESESTVSFSRSHPLADDSISWASPGITVSPSARGTRSETFEISAPSSDAGKIIFAKSWYPGYRATLNGQALPVSVYRDLFPEVEIPAGDHGRLEITYWPAGLTAGLAIAGCSLFGSLLVSLLGLYRRRSYGVA
jgi:hypothetical protein